jgi:hypothetical protein
MINTIILIERERKLKEREVTIVLTPSMSKSISSGLVVEAANAAASACLSSLALRASAYI